MKPTDELIKWLKENPAVWEALQEEWEPAPGDWFLHLETEHIGLLATEESDEIVYIDKEAWYWLPTLGQLVRMLIEASPKGLLEFDSSRFTTSRSGAVDRNWSARLNKKQSLLGGEPEIACLALWAKVKGVECD